MAMRDPGTPGRNPFFDHGPDAELGDLAGLDDERGEEAAGAFGAGQFGPGEFGADAFGLGAEGFDPDGPGPGFSDGSDAWSAGPGVDPLGTLVALVDALQGAQPEATEHLVAAAHELVLAVKTVVDATEAVLAAQRSAPRGAARSSEQETDDTPPDPFSSDSPPTSSRTSGVRRIDLA
jgi:hypothetical protein